MKLEQRVHDVEAMLRAKLADTSRQLGVKTIQVQELQKALEEQQGDSGATLEALKQTEKRVLVSCPLLGARHR